MNIDNEKKLQVSAIKDGTVIDRIPPLSLFKVIEILGLDHTGNQITFGTNLDSKHLGKKAIIKIADSFFEDEDINRIALFAPDAKFNIIKNYEVIEKRQVAIPEHISGIAKCFNPKCITNHQNVKTRFTTKKGKEGISLVCHYCEKITQTKNLQIISKS
ncbi:MAG: aspartate carbamoyltransferase regulatory subunit [Prevotellaceae bacterium]|jgi:aspartate carbamoyltransferase regulatory subunit|nr:aspartate carbamoyltransferase regulatory subunit [Prevotellaceae bacterium]